MCYISVALCAVERLTIFLVDFGQSYSSMGMFSPYYGLLLDFIDQNISIYYQQSLLLQYDRFVPIILTIILSY